jgi:hypothetical protein
MAVGNFDGHNSEVAVLGNSTITVMLNNGSSAPASLGAAPAKGTGQIVGTGLTSNGTRQAFLLTPDEAGIRRGIDPGVVRGVSGFETAGVVDTVGAPQALREPNAAGEPTPDDTAAPLLVLDQLNALPWLSKARKIKWAIRTRSISGLPY